MQSRVLLDWLSFTVPIALPDAELMSHAFHNHLRNELWLNHELLWGSIIDQHSDISQGSGRKPYNISWHTKTGIAWFASPGHDHVLFEFSGQGCEWLRSMGLETAMIAAYAERMTRIDIALDIVTETKPTDFTANRENRRVRSESVVKSDSGETVYLGGRKSERYMRCYRYNPPHPRSQYLRLEFVQRKKYAKQTAHEYMRLITSSSQEKVLHSMVHELGARFGLDHNDWQPQHYEQVSIDTYRPERKSGKTEFWLVSQVAPAFKKLVSQGVIENPIEWLQEHFLEKEQRLWQ